MLSTGRKQAACIFLGIVTFSSFWLITTDPVFRFFNHMSEVSRLQNSAPKITKANVRMDKKNYSFVILDYNQYIIMNASSDYFVGNCLITKNHSLVERADAVVITSRKLKSKKNLPKFRQQWQRWVWLIDENPHHLDIKPPFKIEDFKNVYNWTMTYRTNSDVSIPYGWKKLKSEPEKTIPDLGKRDKMVAAVISNCNPNRVHNSRMKYIQMLRKTVPVILYGKCGTKCEGYSNNRYFSFCPKLSRYLFYLAFENSNCREYITEKLFANGFESGAVPVVLGAFKEDYINIAPPNSFIYLGDFEGPQQLGEYLKYLAHNTTAYMQYHEWHKNYVIISRLQAMSKSVWRPLCEKLNKKSGVEKIISDLKDIWKLSDCDGFLRQENGSVYVRRKGEILGTVVGRVQYTTIKDSIRTTKYLKELYQSHMCVRVYTSMTP